MRINRSVGLGRDKVQRDLVQLLEWKVATLRAISSFTCTRDCLLPPGVERDDDARSGSAVIICGLCRLAVKRVGSAPAPRLPYDSWPPRDVRADRRQTFDGLTIRIIERDTAPLTALVAPIFGSMLRSDGAVVIYASDDEFLVSAGVRSPRTDLTIRVGAASAVEARHERYRITYEVSRTGNPRTLRFDGEFVRALDENADDPGRSIAGYVGWIVARRLAKTIL